MPKHSLAIRATTDDPASLATIAQLERIASDYDLSKWIFTREVVIDRNSIPHSHPVLTLHTRHLDSDDLLLATFLHEQLHWFLVQQPEERVAGALRDLRALFPSVPDGPPEGAHDEKSSYLHLIVNYLELEALTEVIGEDRARAVLEFWVGDHYRWIYRTVLDRAGDIRGILSEHGLLDINAAV